MKLHRYLLLGLLSSIPAFAVTANMQFVSDAGGSGVFIFNVNGQLRHLFCTQFFPNATTLPYVANVATLANLAGSTLALQGDPQALFKYQRVAILDLLALADPSIAPAAVRANRRIVDGVGGLTGGAQALYDFALAANAADYDLTGFRIYTYASVPSQSQEVTGFDPGSMRICKIAGQGVVVGTAFNFSITGAPPVTVNAGASPGTCSAFFEVPGGARTITETLPSGVTVSSIVTNPAGALINTTLSSGLANVNVPYGGQVTVTYTNGPGTFTGDITVCKVAGNGVAVGTNTTFNVAGTPVVVAAGAGPNGNCSTPITVPAGGALITETIPAGSALTSVTTVPAGLVASSNLGAGTATITVAAGSQTTVNFVNAVPSPQNGYIKICKVAGTGVAEGTIFMFSVSGTPFPVPAGPGPTGICSPSLEVPAGLTSVTETLQPQIKLASIATLPSAGLLVSSSLLAGTASVTVEPGNLTTVTFTNEFDNIIIPPVTPETPGPYQIRYVSNLNLGDSYVNITNTGAGGGTICANVYAFSPDEQMVSCCSCPVTPNALVSLSVRNDIISNTLTPAVPTSLVIKLLSTQAVAGACLGSAGAVNTTNLALGLAAWGTTLHVGPTRTVTTETPFLKATLSVGSNRPGDIGELSRLGQLCNFIIGNGSGFGVCRSCRLGGLGAGRL